tara:strand:- start:22020 stop:22331 length:312 start_codon:yes stop_codon:yes gene_type:complete
MAKDPFMHLILGAIPNTSIEEIQELIMGCEHLYDEKIKSITDLDGWIPSREAVTEGYPELQSKSISIDKALSTFKELCKEKNWGLNDRLDSRFIVHCKVIRGK